MGREKRDTNSEGVREEYVLSQLENMLWSYHQNLHNCLPERGDGHYTQLPGGRSYHYYTEPEVSLPKSKSLRSSVS